jgi:uncharacterized protein YcaQ
MPILYGDQLVARLDARVERSGEKLAVNGLWLEEWFSADGAFAQALARGLTNLAHLLHARTVNVEVLDPAVLRGEVTRFLRAAGLAG